MCFKAIFPDIPGDLGCNISDIYHGTGWKGTYTWWLGHFYTFVNSFKWVHWFRCVQLNSCLRFDRGVDLYRYLQSYRCVIRITLVAEGCAFGNVYTSINVYSRTNVSSWTEYISKTGVYSCTACTIVHMCTVVHMISVVQLCTFLHECTFVHVCTAVQMISEHRCVQLYIWFQ